MHPQENERLDRLIAYFRELLDAVSKNAVAGSEEAIERKVLLARIEKLEYQRQEFPDVAEPFVPIRQDEEESSLPKPTVRIVVIDDLEVVRERLKLIVESQPGWKVVGEAADGTTAIQVVKILEPDIVTTDIEHPGLNGFEVIRWIAANLPQVRVLAVTMHANKQFVREILEAGGRGYLLTSDAQQLLIPAIRDVLDGKRFFPAQTSEILLDGFLERREPSEAGALLKPREIEIVRLLVRGKSSKEAASELQISLRTAETHRANIMNKLQLRSLQDLVRYAVVHKLVEL